jgi:azobenzene reductase
MTSRTRILLLGGSLARPSRTAALMRAMERVLAVGGGATCRWDIAQRPLPPVQPGLDADPPDPDRRALLVAADAADGLVIASPLYHNSYSGSVKDALDHLSPRQLTGKPVALLSNSGRRISSQALDHLRAVVRALHAIAIPRQVVTVDGDYVLDGDQYRLDSPEIDARLQQLAVELLWFTERLRRDVDSAARHTDAGAVHAPRATPRRALATTTRRK